MILHPDMGDDFREKRRARIPHRAWDPPPGCKIWTLSVTGKNAAGRGRGEDVAGEVTGGYRLRRS